MLDPTDIPPSCVHCGQPIGVYEPLVYQRGGADAPVRSAFLALPDDVRASASLMRFFHLACYTAMGLATSI